MDPALWLAAAVGLPLAGALGNGLLAFRAPAARGLVTALGVGTVLGAFVASVAAVAALVQGGAPLTLTLWTWMASAGLDIDVAFRLDQLSAVMLLVITGVGSLIHLFSAGYMRDDAGYARYFAYLNLFVACMLVLVLGASLPILFIGWEGVGLCSYLLIGFWFEVKANADAGKKAFLANRVGDAGVLLAMFLLFWGLGTLDFAEIAAQAPERLEAGGALVTAIALLLFLGCTGKSAQIPLYVWLPDAMAGPTPVSALIHAATMVTAGVYLVARTGVLFALAPTASAVVGGIGAVTAVWAALIALRQSDIKKVLAYSTVSQLGYMFLGVGAGAHAAGIFHVVTHAFFKALLFLGAGSVIHAMHHALHHASAADDPQDLRNMGGLRAAMPWTAALMGVATLAIAGVPPLSGFFSKDEILAAAFGRGGTEPLFRLYWALGLVAALCTAVYMARLFVLAFLGAPRLDAVRGHVHEAPAIMTGPLVVLGVLAAAGGVLNLPAFVGGGHALAHWLAPVLAPVEALRPLAMPHGSTELGLVAATVLLGLAGLWLGARAARAEPAVPARLAAPLTGLARVLERRFYVDELYDRVVVGPLVKVARDVLWQGVDRAVVDVGIVGGLSRLVQGLGAVGSRLQTGQVGLYVVVFVVGAVVLLRLVIG